ncbi:hypothetical protein [Streptomyces sp. NPDC057889]|uniref:hypothetical protein n=1 Tax=unclassified Streptomyces TaxID=2593676 RepID=UPI00367B7BF6
MWQVNNMTPTLKNTVTDADGDMSTLTFEVWTTDANGAPKDLVNLDSSNPYGVMVSEPVATGKPASVQVPWGKLSPGTTYTFHTSAFDGSLYETGWSPWAKFKLRERAVDIVLPAPDPNAADPAFDTRWQTGLPGWGPTGSRAIAKAGSDRHCESAGSGKTQLCFTTMPASEVDIKKAAESRAKLRSSRTLASSLIPDCDDPDGTPAGDIGSSAKRDQACLYNKVAVEVTDEAGLESKGYQLFLMSYQMQTDLAGTEIKLWARVTPLPMPAGKTPFPAQPGAIKLTLSPQCSAGCMDKPAYDWSGNLMWGGSYDIDPHEETGTATVQWSGGVKDELSTKDADLKQDMAFAPYATFSTSVPETFPTDNSSGFIGSPVYTRCDMVYSPAGCVMRDYMPGYVFNTKKTPAAAAHAWLIQEKIRKGAPLSYLPDRRGTTGAHGERNKYGRDPDANRKVICPDGWAAKSGHSAATTVTDISASDTLSCDEFAFASTYNSGGMPTDMEGTNPVTSGDQCLQTYSRKLTSSGNWHLFDDDRRAAPTYKEVCGRSTMSGWVNSTSMSRFPTFAKQLRLLDEDLYFVTTPGFENCDASAAVVKCDIR